MDKEYNARLEENLSSLRRMKMMGDLVRLNITRTGYPEYVGLVTVYDNMAQSLENLIKRHENLSAEICPNCNQLIPKKG